MNFIFKGAMSFGSISIETHETLAIAMNRYCLCYVSNVSILMGAIEWRNTRSINIVNNLVTLITVFPFNPSQTAMRVRESCKSRPSSLVRHSHQLWAASNFDESWENCNNKLSLFNSLSNFILVWSGRIDRYCLCYTSLSHFSETYLHFHFNDFLIQDGR